MKNILDEIIEVKKEEVKILRSDFTYSRFKDSQFFENECLDFENSILSNNVIGIIAEIKKASPSKGIIREDFNHLKIAEIYFKHNVQAVSVLTDNIFFQGNIKFLNEIASFKESPLLRKDFIIDEFQIFEAKSNGADIILLISEILSELQIKELTSAAKDLGLSVLLEIHSKNELTKIDFNVNNIIGINNRNLKDFSVSLNTTNELSKLLPANTILISESGISNKNDINYLKGTSVKGILVGEHLMSSKNIEYSLQELKEWCQNEG